MSTIVHFLNVGQGNMSLIQTAGGHAFVFDCNITEENKDSVLHYLLSVLGSRALIRAFICSHRDADHIRGVTTLHEHFPIQKIWDSGYPGTTNDTLEYQQYMALRRSVGHVVIKRRTRQDFGRTRFRFLSAADERLPNNANAQGIVLKIEHRSDNGAMLEGSVMLTGDSDAETWRYGILRDYASSNLSCDVLLAAHHGSISFFDDPKDKKRYYTDHIQAMKPAITIISVGKNSHGHPDPEAVALYEKYSSGSNKGIKVFRTDLHGNIRVELKDGGGWRLNKQP